MSAAYCTLTHLQNALSAAGVSLRSADTTVAVASDWAIDRASGIIDEHGLLRYGTQLSNSRWVTNACSAIALVYLCQRMGNAIPAVFLLEYDRLMGTDPNKGGVLESISRGRRNIPDVPALASGAPKGVNVHVREIPTPHVVVEPERTTDAESPKTPRQDEYDPLKYTPANW